MACYDLSVLKHRGDRKPTQPSLPYAWDANIARNAFRPKRLARCWNLKSDTNLSMGRFSDVLHCNIKRLKYRVEKIHRDHIIRVSSQVSNTYSPLKINSKQNKVA